jgi:ribosomal protein S18 acetylase RimI-like enzyme
MRDVIDETWGWDETWQLRDFDRRFRDYVVSIIECDGHAVGGLLLEWKPDSVYIHELQVLPDHQGRGLGTAVVERVIEEAATRGVPVILSVVPANPRAKQLYERLGFEVTGFEGPFFECGMGRDCLASRTRDLDHTPGTTEASRPGTTDSRLLEGHRNG